MAVSTISGTRLLGVSATVPEQSHGSAETTAAFGQELARRIADNTGVRKRHIAPLDMTTSDLCEDAARRLLVALAWDTESVDVLIFVSQTPDYVLPATSCVLQARLGLPTSCAAFDVSLGCSGFIYGLWLASSLLREGGPQRALILCGDTTSKFVSPQDHSAAPLFGDAGTAAAVAWDPSAPAMTFHLGTDGRGQRHAVIPAGGFRTPRSRRTGVRTEREGGNVRSDEDLHMNGAGVLAFTMQEVPRLIRRSLDAAGWTIENVDAFVMHQANRFILQYLTKRLALPDDKVVVALEEFGNTSSASIPLSIAHALAPRLREGELRLLLASFGNGFSWGAASVTCGPMTVLDIERIPRLAVGAS
jgi:3-oxoacyl-[acyl-carrier-protein] synthase-3